MSPDELGVLLAAHCRHATTELPPGQPGVIGDHDGLAVELAAAAGRERRAVAAVTAGGASSRTRADVHGGRRG